MAKKSNIDLADIEIPPKDEEELELERLVFGDKDGFDNNLKNIDNLFNDISDVEYSDKEDDLSNGDEDSDMAELADDQLFFQDNGDEDAMDVDEEEEDEEEDEDEDDDNAWNDSDDERMKIDIVKSDKLKKLKTTETDGYINGREYVNRLRSQFLKIYEEPKWYIDYKSGVEDENESGDDVDSDHDDELNNNTSSLLKILESSATYNTTKKLKLLPPHKLNIVRLKDVNPKHDIKSGIQSIYFHPTSPLLLTGGFDKTLRVFHIDGKTNQVVTTLHLKNFPISSAILHPTSNKVFVGARRRYMYRWDINTGEYEKISRLYGHQDTQRSFEYLKISSSGKYIGMVGNNGWCNVLSGTTGQWIKGFKIDGQIVDVEFSHDDRTIFIINSGGEVCEYNIESNKIIEKWNDDNGIGITKMKLGGVNDRWLAVGTNTGIVNVYDRSKNEKKPVATIDNLVTSISTIEFTSDGQLMCIASRAKKDAMRMVHLPSGSVFSNWPTSGTPLGKVLDVKFSPNDEMVAVGNEAGVVRLWRLNHY